MSVRHAANFFLVSPHLAASLTAGLLYRRFFAASRILDASPLCIMESSYPRRAYGYRAQPPEEHKPLPTD